MKPEHVFVQQPAPPAEEASATEKILQPMPLPDARSGTREAAEIVDTEPETVPSPRGSTREEPIDSDAAETILHIRYAEPSVRSGEDGAIVQPGEVGDEVSIEHAPASIRKIPHADEFSPAMHEPRLRDVSVDEIAQAQASTLISHPRKYPVQEIAVASVQGGDMSRPMQDEPIPVPLVTRKERSPLGQIVRGAKRRLQGFFSKETPPTVRSSDGVSIENPVESSHDKESAA